MKKPVSAMLRAIICLCAVSTAFCATAPAAKSAKPTPDKKPVEAAAATKNAPTAVISIPKSIFTVPANPREGRNPFFPEPVEVKMASATKSAPLSVQTALVLNGITGPPKRTAMINGRTFEVGEKGEVKLKDGSRVPVECVEVKDDSVVILTGSQRVELRLRGGY